MNWAAIAGCLIVIGVSLRNMHTGWWEPERAIVTALFFAFVIGYVLAKDAKGNKNGSTIEREYPKSRRD